VPTLQIIENIKVILFSALLLGVKFTVYRQ